MKNVVVISVIVIVGFVAILMSIDTTQGQQIKTPNQKDEPTVVKAGEYTKEEKAYSKYYRTIYKNEVSRKLTEVNEPGGLGIVIGAGHEPTGRGETDKTDIDFFSEMSCQADVIVIGKVKDKRSHLTDDEKFIFTSYDFEVERIVKDNQNKALTKKSSIEVTRPGGYIKIKDQVIRLSDGSFDPLDKGTKYLLFLKYIPEADGYVVSNSRSDFKINDKNGFESIAGGKRPKNLEEGDSTDILVSKIQSSFVGDCSQYNKGGE